MLGIVERIRADALQAAHIQAPPQIERKERQVRAGRRKADIALALSARCGVLAQLLAERRELHQIAGIGVTAVGVARELLHVRQLQAHERARAPHRLEVTLTHELLIRLGDRPARNAERGSRIPCRRNALAARKAAIHDSRPPELIDLPRERHRRFGIDRDDDTHKWPIQFAGKWLMSAWATLSTMTSV